MKCSVVAWRTGYRYSPTCRRGKFPVPATHMIFPSVINKATNVARNVFVFAVFHRGLQNPEQLLLPRIDDLLLFAASLAGSVMSRRSLGTCCKTSADNLTGAGVCRRTLDASCGRRCHWGTGVGVRRLSHGFTFQRDDLVLPGLATERTIFLPQKSISRADGKKF